VDVCNERELDAFCAGCSLIINCSGPAALIGERAAKAALAHKCHFVDPGGYTPLYHALGGQEISREGLVFFLAAGILPGLSEIFPPYVADREFDSVESVEYAIIGRDAWTFPSAYDIAWGVGNIGQGETAGYFEQGKYKEASLLQSGRRLHLPPPVGKHVLFRLLREDMKDFIRMRRIPTAHVYGNNWGKWVSLSTIFIRLAGLHKTERQLRSAARLIMLASRLDMRGKDSGFMLHLRMQGVRDGSRRSVSRTVYFTDSYRATGLCAAIGARLILEGRLQPGLYRGASLPDPGAFMEYFLDQGYAVTGEDIIPPREAAPAQGQESMP
jgi:saccharopine dehydrogenase-like NADP-dependent oxidoreductase